MAPALRNTGSLFTGHVALSKTESRLRRIAIYTFRVVFPAQPDLEFAILLEGFKFLRKQDISVVFADNGQLVLIDDQFGGHPAVEGETRIHGIKEGYGGKRTISPEGIFVPGVS